MDYSRIIAALGFIGLLASSSVAADQGYSTQVTFTQSNDGSPAETYTTTATFGLTVPDGVSTVRGILTFSGISPSAGARAFAIRNQFGLLSLSGMGSNYTRAYGGSGQALLTGLSQLSLSAGRPELNNVPLILSGYSIGGQFAYEFAAWKPERTLAYGTGKGGFYFTIEGTAPSAAPIWHVMTPEARGVPGILMAGSTDTGSGTSYGGISYTRHTVLEHIMDETRPLGSRFSRAMEWGTGHVWGNVEPLYYRYFDAVIGARLPGTDPRIAPVALNAIPESSGWLGDDARLAKDGNTARIRPAIASSASYAGDKSAASWFPNADTAATWRAFSAADRPNSADESFRFVTITGGLASGLNSATILNPGDDLSISVAVDGGFGTAAKVEFYDGATRLGESTGPNYTFNWQNPGVGTHSFYAVASDLGGNQAYSMPRWVEVVPEPAAISAVAVSALAMLRRPRR